MTQLTRLVSFLLLFALPFLLSAQQHPADIYIGSDAPPYILLMQAESPNVFEVTQAYEAYYRTHAFEKNSYTQYYKRWMNWSRPYMQADGTLRVPTPEEDAAAEAQALALRQTEQTANKGNAGWTFAGPNQTFHTDGTTEVTWQTNIYSIDIAPSDPNILYAGGETGGVWFSNDKGLTWQLRTQTMKHGAFGAIEIHPADPAIVYAATNGKILKSIDAGQSWTTVYAENNLWVNDLAISPTTPNIVLAASDQGLLRTADAGSSWNRVHPQQTWTVEFKVDNANVVFAARKSGNGSDFRLSTDAGASFSNSNDGWWSPGPGESCTGVMLAVCPSNTQKIYAYIIGSGSNLRGYAGVFVSTDGGNSWNNTNPDGSIGNSPTPYSIPTHTNLMTNNGLFSGFEQGFYDMAIVVNPLNDLQLIAGGTSWFRSNDGGRTWSGLGGYVSGLPWSHPDIQALAASLTDLWIASDGGLNYSNDFAESMQARMNGISGADLWGFDAGWNEDVLVGGRYHNGNMAWHQSFPAGKFYRMGGAESPTGYVNPGDNRKTYFSDIGGYRLKGGFTDGVSAFSVGLFPNESYAYYANSEMAWDPRCWNIVYIGKDNKIWKSTDGGTSYQVLYTFPGDANNEVFEIEISRSNPQVMYCSQWDGTDDAMWRSSNGGQTWTQLAPLTTTGNNNNDRVKMAVSAENEDVLWVAVTYGNNGNKIFKSTDGGQSWANLTTPVLNGIRIANIMAQYGTDGGIYLGTNSGVFYRNNQLPTWVPYSNGLPVSAETNRLKPFYRDGKIRNGAWGFGVWEADLFEPSAIIAQPIASALETNCARDTIYFDDYSVVKHDANTAWSWAFSPQPSYISAIDVRNPKVVFGTPGTYTATMTLNGQYTQSLSIVVTHGCSADTIPDKAALLGGNNNTGYVALPPLGLTTNTITFTAWVKPDDIQPDYSAIYMHDGDAAGFNFLPNSNHIGYHWKEGAWWWDSGLTAPSGVWSHVAMVVTPDSISIYVNGRRSTHAFSVPPMNLSETARLGNYRGWGGRYMKGTIEEFSIFNKSLSQSEVRELMHLTRKPAEWPNLVSYYQFNEATGQVLDRVGTRHAALVGSAVRTTSTAPVGGGVSKRLTVTAGGVYDFAPTGVVLGFPATGLYPNGELCVSRLHVPPDQLPNADPNSGGYWVIHNYGTNASFAQLDSLRFERIGNIEAGADAAGFHLFKRGSTAHGNTWGNSVDDGDRSVPGSNGNGVITFSANNGQTQFSQFIITRSTGPLPVEWLDFRAALQDDQSVRLYWSVNQTADVSHFVVEKSRDGLLYTPAGQVNAQPGAGLLRYETQDAQPYKGITYYRLRQLDVTGESSLSPVRTVVLQASAQAWALFPNPLEAGQTLHLVPAEEGTYRVRIFETSGKLLFDRSFNGPAEVSALRLPAGVYACEITSDTRRQTGRLVIR